MKYLRWPLWYWVLALIPVLSAIPGVIGGELRAVDDLLRFVQARDLIAGDTWFDTTQPRFLSPEGGDIHWSRLPDIILILLHWPLRLFVDVDTALRIVAALWPPTLLLLVFTLALRLTGKISPHPSAQILGGLALAFAYTSTQFTPGRIDHHGLVLTFALAAILCGFGATKRSALLGGIFTAATLGVALEGLPMVVGVILIMGVFWIADPDKQSARLSRFGLSLGGTAALLYILDAPGIGDRRDVVDAFGTVHLFALLGGGAILFLLGRNQKLRETSWSTRLIAGATGGGTISVITYGFFPDIFGSPYADIPDHVRTGWLQQVGEARSMIADFNLYGLRVVGRHIFPFTVLIAGTYWILRSPIDTRLRRGALLSLLFIAALATIWQVRSLHYSHTLAAILAGAISADALQRWLDHRGAKSLLRAAVIIALISPLPWRNVGSLASANVERTKPTKCLAAELYAEVSDLPEMRILAPLSMGPAILAATPHSIFSAPYHRNIGGIALALDIFGGPPEEALAGLAEIKADAIAWCPGFGEHVLYQSDKTDSLGEQLERREPPTWLQPISAPEGTVNFYKIQYDTAFDTAGTSIDAD